MKIYRWANQEKVHGKETKSINQNLSNLHNSTGLMVRYTQLGEQNKEEVRRIGSNKKWVLWMGREAEQARKKENDMPS